MKKVVLPAEVAERCISIRKRAKMGQYISPDEMHFCEKMLRQFPIWYKDTESRIFNESKPFGSNIDDKTETD